MGFTDKLKDFIAPEIEEGEGELELTKEEASALSQYEAPRNPSASNIPNEAKIVLFEPRNFEEAQEIGTHIKCKRACCINLHRMPNEYRQRVIDFLSGVVFGVNGSIKKIGDNVILCSPRDLQVGGNIDLQTGE